MQPDKTTTAVNAAIFIIGSYHVPAGVAIGALIGASLFVLSQKSYGPISKAWMFAVSFFSGIFGYDSAENILNWFLPGDSLHINAFTAATVFSAMIVLSLQKLIQFVGDSNFRKE